MEIFQIKIRDADAKPNLPETEKLAECSGRNSTLTFGIARAGALHWQRLHAVCCPGNPVS
jgi:hypothetical protein